MRLLVRVWRDNHRICFHKASDAVNAEGGAIIQQSHIDKPDRVTMLAYTDLSVDNRKAMSIEDHVYLTSCSSRHHRQ